MMGLTRCDKMAVFTVRLHAMQRTVLRRPFCLSVRPSVCLTVKRVDCDKTKEIVVEWSWTRY